MTAALGTLPFLATLWLLMVLGAAVLEDSGGKIAAALKGKVPDQQPFVPGRLRLRCGLRKATRAAPRLRAAA
jgi:hypothetical protein